MKVTFKESTHPMGECIEGVEGELSIGMTLSFTFNPMKKETVLDDEGRVIEPGEYYDFELRRGVWNTSKLKSITYEEISRGCFIITVNTRNSTYIFQSGKVSDEKPLTDDEILNMQLALGMYLI